jgi:hypothetical protein
MKIRLEYYVINIISKSCYLTGSNYSKIKSIENLQNKKFGQITHVLSRITHILNFI